MKRIDKLFLSIFILFFITASFASSNTNFQLRTKVKTLLNSMTLRQKIGQKLMLDFRYWCNDNSQPCTTDFTQMNPTVAQILQAKNIGGLILFANNAKSLEQIKWLTTAAQMSMYRPGGLNLGLLISTDQEGGIVTRLPSNETATFSGNMAIGAATLGLPKQRNAYNTHYAYDVGQALGQQLASVGINTDNAPDVDVNVNAKNPVINVRSFSDDPDLVFPLGQTMVDGIQSIGVAATLKHFPGHGDTSTDSHTGLPHVNHTWAQAWAIDLYPFQHIIQSNTAPDMLMTAHIQFPVLDNSMIWADKIKQDITVPATLSYRIQHGLLRGNEYKDSNGHTCIPGSPGCHKELGFTGVSITDALDMGAIADNFTQETAVIDAFKAGDDMALMPVEVSKPSDIANLNHLIDAVVDAVHKGEISEQEIDTSVSRILTLKAKLGLLGSSWTNKKYIPKSHQELETDLANHSITLVQNTNNLLPIILHDGEHIHILTSWGEQGEAIAQEIKTLQAAGNLPKMLTVTYDKISATTEDAQKAKVNTADLVIVGDLTKGSAPLSSLTQSRFTTTINPSPVVFPDMPMGDSTQLESIGASNAFYSQDGISGAQFAYDILNYAHTLKKTTIFISVLSPYDLPIYHNVSDAMLVGYDYYGYLETPTGNYFRGPAMQAIARTIFKDVKTGKAINTPTAKLPVNVPDPNDLNKIIYPRGFGLTY